jgi:uncharacterized protein (TIGR02266 family)
MTKTIEKLEANAQLDRALDTLREGLALTQDLPLDTKSGAVDNVAAALAKCIQNIFNLKGVGLSDPASPTHIRAAMDHLRKTLSLLQDSHLQSNIAEKTTRTVARCLALLYPVSSLIDQLKAIPRRKDGSIPPDFVLDYKKSSFPPPYATEADRRSAVRQVVEVEIGVHSGTNFFTGFSQDISSGGLFISTYDTLPIGAKVNVNFSLPFGPVFSVDGTVRWLREFNEFTPDVIPGMGVQFESLTDEEIEILNEYIAEIPPLFYE